MSGFYGLTRMMCAALFGVMVLGFGTFAEVRAAGRGGFFQSSTPNIFGRVGNSTGAGIANVTLTVTVERQNAATQTFTTQTDANGDYAFNNLPVGFRFIVTPSRSGFVFNPVSRGISAPNDFAAENVRFDFEGAEEGQFVTVFGRVLNTDGNAFAGVTVTLTNTSGTINLQRLTSSEGFFSFSGVPSRDTYTLTASFQSDANVVFIPNPTTLPNLTFNTFVEIKQGVKVSGRITNESGASVADVTVRFVSADSDTQVTTNSAGEYAVALESNKTYTVSPFKANTQFEPGSVTLTQLRQPQTLNFTARTSATYSISGRVTQSNGEGVSGILITLGGSQVAQATTDINGFYRFENLRGGGNFTISGEPTAKGALSPETQAVNNLDGDKVVNFVAPTSTRRTMRRVKRS